MLRICISGLTGSGKSTIGSRLAEGLNIMNITKELTKSYSKFKKDSNKNNLKDIIETANTEYAKSFDREIAKLASKNNCVVTTWLGPWIVKNPTIRVWLNASVEERARRKSLKDGMKLSEAKKYVMLKDRLTIDSFKNIYGINVMDHSAFDLEINTERVSIDATVSIISLLSAEKGKLAFR
ncbi:MAG: AAA family ATPase [Candidatus Micrarchaeia archaeon]